MLITAPPADDHFNIWFDTLRLFQHHHRGKSHWRIVFLAATAAQEAQVSLCLSVCVCVRNLVGIVSLQHCNITTLQHCKNYNIATLQHYTIATLPQCGITTMQHCNVVALPLRNFETLQL